MAQNKNMSKKEVKSTISLGKQAIVNLALKQLDTEVDTSYFKSIKVMASDNDIYVAFQNPITFIPENAVYFYNVTVFLNGSNYLQPRKNPETITYNLEEVQFFKYDDAVLDKIKFVIKAIDKQDVVEVIDWEYYADYNGMTIYDRGDHYYVEKSYGEFNEAAYIINKSTGIAIEEYHAELAPDPMEDAVKYVEIKN